MRNESSVNGHLDEVNAALAALTEALETEAGDEELLDAVCAQAVRAIPGADLASVTAIHTGSPRTAASTDDRAVEIDRVQYALGDGPCLEAARSGEIVRLSVSTADRAWPDFATTARKLGVGSYLAAPLHIDETLSGALNLFGFGDHGFRDSDSELLKLYTTVVSSGLRTARRYRDTRRLALQLEDAMRTRGVIEQAKGILMAVHKVSADEAFRLLVTESQHNNTKLHEVASRFVRSVTAGIPADRSIETG
ncbi:transcriptional regulator [Amycolatopsis thailandensis]|uniref:Transcriptional regulator n=1 Tax=Amycolatopsis thailandensis TaxID=589330 RepID=A0A229SF51_9PSEU|nr:GAF and ANTAR domain-containing protein [Amycolatopsis thailandensis]OXM57557.1 transcriptional regulator [Amycolatopsis thailandensis]